MYIGEIENRYLTGETRRRVFHGFYKLPMVKTNNRRELLADGRILRIDGIKIECILVPGHTWGHMVYLIDDQYLFTGDTIWFGADGGYSFISTLAEDNNLALQSLEKLEKNIRARKNPICVITGHTGWMDDLDFVFAHRKEICRPFTRRYADPEAPFDGYVEDDDTEKRPVVSVWQRRRLFPPPPAPGHCEGTSFIKPDSLIGDIFRRARDDRGGKHVNNRHSNKLDSMRILW